MSEFLSAADKLKCVVADCNVDHSFWSRVFVIFNAGSVFLYFGQLLAAVYNVEDWWFVWLFLGSTVSHLISWGLNFAIDRSAPPCSHQDTDTPSRVVQYMTFFSLVMTLGPAMFARDESLRNVSALAIIVPLTVIAELHLGTNDPEGVFSGLAIAVVIAVAWLLLARYVAYPYGRRLMRAFNTSYGHETSTWAYLLHTCVIYPLSCEDKRTQPTGIYSLIKCTVFGHELEHEHPAVRVVPVKPVKSARDMVSGPQDDNPFPFDATSDAVGTSALANPKHAVVGFNIEYINGGGGVLRTEKYEIATLVETEDLWRAYITKEAPYSSLSMVGGVEASYRVGAMGVKTEEPISAYASLKSRKR